MIVLAGHAWRGFYSAAQEARAHAAGCTDALTYLGEPAVVSVGTLFQAAFLPGILLALLYALYAFGYALLNPTKAPAVAMGVDQRRTRHTRRSLTWFLVVPDRLIGGAILLGNLGHVGSQNVLMSQLLDIGEGASLRTNVSEMRRLR